MSETFKLNESCVVRHNVLSHLCGIAVATELVIHNYGYSYRVHIDDKDTNVDKTKH